MTRADRLVLAAPLAAAGLTLGGAWDQWFLAGVLALMALLTVAPPARMDVGSTMQLMVALFGGVSAWFIAIAITPEEAHWWNGELTLGAGGVALMLLLISLPRLLIENPWKGYSLTVGMVLFAVICASTALAGPAFWIPGAAYVVLQPIAMNRADPGRPGWSRLSRRHRLILVAGLLAAGAVGGSFAALLPPAADASMRYFGWQMRRFWGRSGFSTQLGLGSLNGMIQSNQKVLRVFGPQPDYLRGIVYTTYSSGRWDTPSIDVRPVMLDADIDEADDTTIWTLGGDKRRLFVPLGVQRVAVEGGEARIDDLGVLQAHPELDATWLRFQLGARDLDPIMPPTDDDVLVPPEIAPELRRLARAWTEGASDPAARLAALESKLRSDFDYSLVVDHDRSVDPTIDFLTRHKQGHCEYFASGMALLSRSLGIPARVAAGYRVTEFNRIGGYHLVREKNAHAWVEAWIVGEGWVTFEPTPPAGLDAQMADATPWGAALVDQLAAWYGLTWAWLLTLEPLHFIIGGVALLFVYLSLRQLITWLQRRKRAATDLAGFEDPRPSLVLLLSTLATAGEARKEREPLEAFARRIRTSPVLGESSGGAAELLLRYSAWRYGHEGDPDLLDRDIEAWISRRS